MASVNSLCQDLPILPALLQATCFALLDAAIPMRCTFSSTVVAISANDELLTEPNATRTGDTKSLHAFTSDSRGQLILIQSEGDFDLRGWERAEQEAQRQNQTKQKDMRRMIQEDLYANKRWNS